MAFDGNGNFNRLFSWVADKANGIPITASRVDGEDNGFAAGLSLCVTRDGQGKPSTNFLPNSDLTLQLGSASFRWSQLNNIQFSSANGITIPAPTSGVLLSLTGAAGAYAQQITGNSTAGQSLGLKVSAGTNGSDATAVFQNQAGSVNFCEIWGNGEITLTQPSTVTQQTATAFQAGYLDAPQNLQNANYSFALTDRGKSASHTSATPHTWTIPANASVAFPIGTVILLLGATGSAAVTLAITTDTLAWAPSGTTGSRTLTAPFVASITKVSATQWLLSGVGVS